jgi:hypothetical protein
MLGDICNANSKEIHKNYNQVMTKEILAKCGLFQKYLKQSMHTLNQIISQMEGIST